MVSLCTLDLHVRESNAIENIFADPGTPEYDDHFAAARLASEGFVRAHVLHSVLARRMPELSVHAGIYRTCGVLVGNRVMPHWKEVPELMSLWNANVDKYVRSSDQGAEGAYVLHVHLLCIHPWVDGNGRTARLVWNMLRLCKGLPWHIEYAAHKDEYYARIRAIEDRIRKIS